MFGNHLACALGDFSENPGKISTFASLVLGGQLCFVGMRSNQLIHRGQIWLGKGFADQLSGLNPLSLLDPRRDRCRCECNPISIQDLKRFARGSKGVATCLAWCVAPAWRGFVKDKTCVTGVWRAELVGHQHNCCPSFTVSLARWWNIYPSVQAAPVGDGVRKVYDWGRKSHFSPLLCWMW